MNNTKLTDLNVGDIIGPLEVIDLRVDGGSLARYDGKVVFLDNAVPGDIVFAQLMENKKKIMFATVTEVVTPSSYRETPWCPHFSLCGGCSWQHISLDYQREWKKKHVKETLKRIGQIDIPVSSVLTSPKDSLTRTKISYVFSFSETIRIGLKQKNQ